MAYAGNQAGASGAIGYLLWLWHTGTRAELVELELELITNPYDTKAIALGRTG